MKIQRVQIVGRTAYLNTQFGLDYACKVFDVTPEYIEEKVGRYSKGKRVGQLRGILCWSHVTIGGWSRTLNRVLRPGSRFGHYVDIGFGEKKVVIGDGESYGGTC